MFLRIKLCVAPRALHVAAGLHGADGSKAYVEKEPAGGVQCAVGTDVDDFELAGAADQWVVERIIRADLTYQFVAVPHLDVVVRVQAAGPGPQGFKGQPDLLAGFSDEVVCAVAFGRQPVVRRFQGFN